MRTLNPILLSLAALLLLWSCSDESNNEALTESDATTLDAAASPWQTVEAPFEGESLLQAQSLRIEDPSQASFFELPDGTTLEVPAMAFAYADGSPVLEPVDISFRSFREAAEIIASGIPMRVKQEDGAEGWMQTAGMFEIRFNSNGQEVDLTEGKQAEVGFVSTVDGPYDFWYFDEAAGNWENRGAGAKPEAITTPTPQQDEAETERQLSSLMQNPPVNPEMDKDEMLGFTDLDVSHIPGLKGSETVMLVYAGKDPAMAPSNNKWVRDAKWLRKKIEPTGQKGVYRLTLLGEKRYSIPVKAALQGEELERAKARYAQELEAYRAKVNDLRNRNFLMEQQAQFRRTIAVQNGGIYNYDILLKMEAAVPLMADFNFQGMPDAIKDAVTVYLITGDNRAVIGFKQYDWKRFRFLPNADNKLLAVMPGNKVAVFSQKNFETEKPKMLKAQNDNYTFDMKIGERRIEKMEDLQAIIEEAS
jgi:hypothetical protein